MKRALFSVLVISFVMPSAYAVDAAIQQACTTALTPAIKAQIV